MKIYIKLLLAIFIVFFSTINSFCQDPNFHIYLAFGQSNMEGHVKYENQDIIKLSERFKVLQSVDCENLDRKKGEWYIAKSPLVRCNTGLSPVDYFGKTLVDSLPENISIGVVNVSIGGCKIELFDKKTSEDYIKTAPEWMKNNLKAYDNDPYNRLLEMAKLAKEKGVIKGVLLHQGESNAGDKKWPKKVKTVYKQLLNDLNLKSKDVPLLVGEVVHAEQKGVCASMNFIINIVPNYINNAHVISSKGCEAFNDKLHFSAQGYRELGKRYALKMLEILDY